ncbi:MAG: glutamate--tRNA ligase [Ignavibacteria bacterium]|nr:glutamate--tRNA ligase [Ignavibacteria bacterium]
MSVRVRFAPSPTGYLHIGGLRTALYNYLFAKKNNGTFVLRIEDTDKARFVEGAMQNLIESLRWAGIDYDEGPNKDAGFGPYIQSERIDLYKEYAQKLIENGNAYYAFDTQEEIELARQKQQAEKLDFKYNRNQMRNQITLGNEEVKSLLESGVPFVIRLKVPEDKTIRFKDIIRGEVVVGSKEVDDQVLLKSDGYPTYHLANVVDDYLMKISHVIRGEEWLPSTPKHILLYEAFNWAPPHFAHLPLLLNKDKTKLSKRQGSVAVEDFRDKGYLSDALVNFVALLGWNPSADREIYAIQELIEHFSLEKINKAGAVFDVQKLDWMNQQYLKNLPNETVALLIASELEKLGIAPQPKSYLEKVAPLFKERVLFVSEIVANADYMFSQPKDFEEEYFKKHWKENTKELISQLIKAIEEIDDFFHSAIQEKIKQFNEEHNIKLKEIIHPIRLMITGKSAGAGMFETMEVLGKSECIKRMNKFINERF